MCSKKTFELRFQADVGMIAIVMRAVGDYCKEMGAKAPIISEICSSVGEAVENAIHFAYPTGGDDREIRIKLQMLEGKMLKAAIKDKGVGIEDVKKAQRMLYTTSTKPCSAGTGFSVMKAFATRMDVKSSLGDGTTVTLWFDLDKKQSWLDDDEDRVGWEEAEGNE